MFHIIYDISTGEITQTPFTPEEQVEFDSAKTAALAAETRTKYIAQRIAEYPSIGDQLDALWKGGEAAKTMLAQVQAVKFKYPKPTE